MRISDWSSDVCSSDLANARYVDVKRPREAFLRNAFLKRFQDHLVLLNDSHAADALVVGYGLVVGRHQADDRSEEHTSELQSLMRISYAVFCLKKKKIITKPNS